MTAEPSSSARWRVRRWLLLLAVLVIGALAVRVLANSSGELLSAADDLTRVSPGWLAAAAAAEVLSSPLSVQRSADCWPLAGSASASSRSLR